MSKRRRINNLNTPAGIADEMAAVYRRTWKGDTTLEDAKAYFGMLNQIRETIDLQEVVENRQHERDDGRVIENGKTKEILAGVEAGDGAME